MLWQQYEAFDTYRSEKQRLVGRLQEQKSWAVTGVSKEKKNPRDNDKAQRDFMNAGGSEPVPWGTGHPVGYWAHDAGPALSGAQRGAEARGASARVLRPGQVFAFDGFFAWKLPGTSGDTKTLSVEEMAVVTETGAEYLIPPQEALVLVRSRGGRPVSPAR